MNGSSRRPATAAPQYSGMTKPTAGDRRSARRSRPRASLEVARAGEQLEERQQRDRREQATRCQAGREPPDRTQPRPARARARARSAPKRPRPRATWKLDSGWPPKNCSATTSASAATGRAPGPPDDAVDSQQQPRHQRPDARQRPRQPDDQVQPEPKTSPASSAPAKRMPSARASRSVPNAAHEQLQRGDHARATTRTAAVGRQVERREERRLRVGQERPPARSVRVPQRHVGQPRRACTARTAGTATTASASSQLAPNSRTPPGARALHGAAVHR